MTASPGITRLTEDLWKEILMDDILASLSAGRAGRARPFHRLLQRLALGRSRRRLAQLEDHLLRDVGLTPSEAQREAEKPIWNAPDHWLR
jgi:uncharacterized protein YjiS (DUF1127 family)